MNKDAHGPNHWKKLSAYLSLHGVHESVPRCWLKAVIAGKSMGCDHKFKVTFNAKVEGQISWCWWSKFSKRCYFNYKHN